tara:strand:- start:8187 stop:8915 length:729 start_codon:yes stop_codon:yes gene_type:complete
MLAFDIETMGLKAGRDDITIVCTEDFFTGEKIAYEFHRLKMAGDAEGYELNKTNMLEAFNSATSLCAFNGMNFDIPFIQKTFNVPDEIIRMWKNKLCDIFYTCKQRFSHTFSLNLLCEKNNVPMKISTGTAAIGMAQNEEWEALKEYCEMDVTILNNLFRRRHLLNPRNNAMMDLSFMAIDRLYSDSPRPGAEQSTLEKYMRLTGDSDLIIPRDKPMEEGHPRPVPHVPATTRDYQRMSLLG